MHYRGLLRVARREKGIRIYSAREQESSLRERSLLLPEEAGRDASAPRGERIDALIDVLVRIYAPLRGPSLSYLVARLRYAVPQWQSELKSALKRAKERLSHTHVNGVDWYWPVNEKAKRHAAQDTVRVLAPFDPVVHDRTRFELLWGWEYRFEAYTPIAKRKLGYYAMPLLWRDHVIGWANLSVKDDELKSEIGYVGSQPRDRAFKRELEAELVRLRVFLGLES